MKKIFLFAAAATMLTACGTADFTEEFNDAPRGTTNDDPANIVSFPDGFGNVAAKCDGPNMVYSGKTGDGRTMAVVADDPRCTEDEPLG